MAIPGENSEKEQRRTAVVALTGFMGCGKTTAGHALAELLGWTFVDLDEVIERREGVAIREIFAQRGEAEFRRVESEALREVLAGGEVSRVIALGGGTFVQELNGLVLGEAGVRTVFLELAVEEMVSRCAAQEVEKERGVRPLAQDEEAFRRLYEVRLPFYRRAELTIGAQGKTAQEIAREIAERLQLSPGKR